MKGKIIVDEAAMNRSLARLAHEIIEQNPSAETIYLIGIKRRGVPLAAILKQNIERFSECKAELGALDIRLYRDDVSERFPDPKVAGTEIPFDVTGKDIVLVDDVLYTGRTARAAMEAVIDIGRPAIIQLAVMVDRGHRELPISANFVGKNIPTARSEFVKVMVPEFDQAMQVVLFQKR